MDRPSDELLRALVDQQLLLSPATLRRYRCDVRVHVAVELGRATLQVVATEMARSGLPDGQIESILRSALQQMLSDQILTASADYLGPAQPTTQPTTVASSVAAPSARLLDHTGSSAAPGAIPPPP